MDRNCISIVCGNRRSHGPAKSTQSVAPRCDHRSDASQSHNDGGSGSCRMLQSSPNREGVGNGKQTAAEWAKTTSRLDDSDCMIFGIFSPSHSQPLLNSRTERRKNDRKQTTPCQNTFLQSDEHRTRIVECMPSTFQNPDRLLGEKWTRTCRRPEVFPVRSGSQASNGKVIAVISANKAPTAPSCTSDTAHAQWQCSNPPEVQGPMARHSDLHSARGECELPLSE